MAERPQSWYRWARGAPAKKVCGLNQCSGSCTWDCPGTEDTVFAPNANKVLLSLFFQESSLEGLLASIPNDWEQLPVLHVLTTAGVPLAFLRVLRVSQAEGRAGYSVRWPFRTWLNI